MPSRNLAAGSFGSLDPPLTPWTLDMVSSMGFAQMTPVQASVIPLFMKNKDVVVEAVTGSGKTLAFVIPILERLIRRQTPPAKHDVGAIIISPTRELATQLHQVVSSFLAAQESVDPDAPSPGEAGPSNPSQTSSSQAQIRPPLLLIGGSAARKDGPDPVSTFRSEGADILIGTPGRMEEFLLGKSSMPGNQKNGSKSEKKLAKSTVKGLVNLKALEVLVLDEADRLLDLGFSSVLTSLLSALPKQRRTGLFSATMSSALASLVRTGLRNPVKVVVKTSAVPKASAAQKEVKGKGKEVESNQLDGNAPEGLESGYVVVDEGSKLAYLKSILDAESSTRAASSSARKFIVFFATGAEVDYWYKIISRMSAFSGYTFHSLHGSLPPARRQATYSAFLSSDALTSSPAVLLTTDVAARGIDVPEVDVVVQMEPPSDPRVFAHRVGRTARAGRSGKAVLFLRRGKEEEYIDFMGIRKMPLQPLSYPSGQVEAAAQELRQIVLADRGLHEMAVKAFVSNIRFYSKHEASYIFRVADLDLLAMARSMGIFRLPQMPELKTSDVPEGGWLDTTVDWDAYAYADKVREQQRQQALASAAKRPRADEEAASIRPTKKQKLRNSTAWSDKVMKKEEKDAKKEKRAEQKAALRAAREAGGKVDELESDDEEGEQDWKELVKAKRTGRRSKREVSADAAPKLDFGGLD